MANTLWNQSVTAIYSPYVPSGLESLLGYMNRAYGNPPVYVQENGKSFLTSINLRASVYYSQGSVNVGQARPATRVSMLLAWLRQCFLVFLIQAHIYNSISIVEIFLTIFSVELQHNLNSYFFIGNWQELTFF